MKTFIAGILVLVASIAANAEPKPQSGPFGGGAKDPMDQVLADVSFADAPLGDVVDFLRDNVSGFKVTVIRAPDSETDPKISLRLHQVSLRQVLSVITKACPVELDSVPPQASTDSAITVLRILETQHSPAASPSVRVYHLVSVTESLRPTAADAPPEKADEHRKAALNDLLSLIKAAIAQVGGSAPVLEIHEATQTLIFKGSLDQRAALEDVLDALDPNRGSKYSVVRDRDIQLQKQMMEGAKSQLAAAKAEVDAAKSDVERQQRMAEERMAELRARNQELQKNLQDQQQRFLQQVEEIERLKIRLEESAQSKPKETKGKE